MINILKDQETAMVLKEFLYKIQNDAQEFQAVKVFLDNWIREHKSIIAAQPQHEVYWVAKYVNGGLIDKRFPNYAVFVEWALQEPDRGNQ